MKTLTSKAAIASGHPRVTEVARDILLAGGNAFDAIVAAGFASATAEPALTSLGGGGFLLAHTASGDTVLFDFFVDTPGRGLGEITPTPHFLPITVNFPGSTQRFNTGLGSAAVPGNLQGFLDVHRRFGRLPLAQVLAPAIDLARTGLRLTPLQGYVLGLLEPIMTLTPRGRAIFAPAGRYLSCGDHFANPELAGFLETLPDGGEHSFYRGALAQRIVQDMREGQGLISAEDLSAYRVMERTPLSVGYRGLQLLTNPPPSWGGTLIGLGLRLLEAFPVTGLNFGSSRHLRLLAAIMEEVDRRRSEVYEGSQGFTKAEVAASLARVRTAFGGTTHISLCDGEGNMASMTTSNGEGSGYVVPGTGIMLNNMLGEDDLHPHGFHVSEPGHRVASMMAPSLLLDDECVRLVLGSGGSKRIRTALLQVVSNRVDFGMDLKTAIEAPRLHWDGASLQLEPGFSAATVAGLTPPWPVNTWSVKDLYFGGVHGVSPRGESAGDSRRDGYGIVLDF